MISYKEAKNKILDAGAQRGCKTQMVSMTDSVYHVCAQDIYAPINIQPFDNSAMDGFAVRLEDLTENGGVLKRSGMIAAGNNVPEKEIPVGCCIEIMTGAPTPPGSDAVVPVELVRVDGDDIYFSTRPKRGANIRLAGEDFAKGSKVLSRGQTISPQHIMPLAALGIDEVTVYKKTTAIFLATGDELVNDLSQDLKPGQIYNSNLPYGLIALKEMGIDCVSTPAIRDDQSQFESFLKDAMKKDIDFIISSGAVSAGKFDFVRKGLETLGAEILFHKVNIRPGKPNLFARLPNGTLYFGLPGNPVATIAGLRFFVEPCLQAMMGCEEERPIRMKSASFFKKRPEPRMFLKAYAENRQDGSFKVRLLDGQASFMVSPFLKASCWAVAVEGQSEIKEEDLIDVYPLYRKNCFFK